MRFIKQWKSMFLSITVVGVFFIVWDVMFTAHGIWGFNDTYHLPLVIGGLPLEEILFFFCIPYASVFIHYSLAYFKPKLLIPAKYTKRLTIVLLFTVIAVLVFNFDKWYTLVNYSLLIVSLLLGLTYGIELLRRFYISFVIILIPFFLVNGILTGSFIAEPVVWYNNSENLGIRLFTIPIEDIGYAFNMLFLVVLLNERLKKIKVAQTLQ